MQVWEKASVLMFGLDLKPVNLRKVAIIFIQLDTLCCNQEVGWQEEVY